MATPLQLWLEKKTYLEQQLAITADANQKFALREQIKECEQEIVRLSNQSQPSIPNRRLIQPQNTTSNKQLSATKLTGQEKEQLQKALLDAFNHQSLKQMLTFKLDKDLDSITTANGFSSIVFDLITTASKEGWIIQLITSAKEYTPNNLSFGLVITNLLQKFLQDNKPNSFEESVIPDLKLNMIIENSPIKNLHYNTFLPQEGAQNLCFSDLLNLKAATPALEIKVTCFADVINKLPDKSLLSSISKGKETRLEPKCYPNYITFSLSESKEDAQIILCLSFAHPVNKISVECNNKFHMLAYGEWTHK